MNGKIAKRIRRAVYKGEKEEPCNERGYTEIFGGAIVSTGNRRLYLAAKKDYKNLKRRGQVTFKSV